MATPDVSVVVAVYNTMPYLRECLDSLLAQSIGRERLEVIAVDDGSTDGSAETLEEYAAQHGGVFKVLHQANSGGPAAPSNRALEQATGRYLYFLGADDYLGPEALERMVGFADEHGSDVVIGKMVGVNGRQVGQGLYDANRTDLDPFGPELRWSLANTKLFRRDLVEKHQLRYREDMPFGSDQPFTLAACVHASRISVLADYTCYYAVKRSDSSNLSYNTPYAERVPCIGQMMDAVAELVPAGPDRDMILTRHWAWEVPRLLRPDLLQRPVEEQHQVCAGVHALADRYLNDDILAAVPVSGRLRICAAVAEDVRLLAALIQDDGDPALPVHVDAEGAFARYTGFRSSSLPDELFRLAPAGVSDRLSRAADLRSTRWTDRALEVEVWIPLAGPAADRALRAELRPFEDGMPIPAQVHADTTETGSTVHIHVEREALVTAGPGAWSVHLFGDLHAGRFRARLRTPATAPQTKALHRGRPYRLAVTEAPRGGQLAVSVRPMGRGEIVSGVLRRLPGRPTNKRT